MNINSKNTSLTVGTTLVTVSEAKQNDKSQRIRLIAINVSTGGQIISLAADGEAVASSGIVLYPGGSMSWEVQANIPIMQSRVTGIANAAGGTLAVYEEVLQ
jgi:hypothetical protein